MFELEHEEAGTLRLLRSPTRFEKTPSCVRRHPPQLGQHTDEILKAAGLGHEEIAKLRETGAIA